VQIVLVLRLPGEPVGGLVEGLQHVELAEHALQRDDDLPVLLVRFLLLGGRGRFVGSLDGRFEVRQHRRHLLAAELPEPAGDFVEHLLLGRRVELLVGQHAQCGGNAASGLLDLGHHSLLLLALGDGVGRVPGLRG
jgi:hypothetical protein